MGSDTIYLDTQGIENQIYNGLVESLPDLTPLLRASYVYELQAVERRLEVLAGHEAMRYEDETLLNVTPADEQRARGLWKRRGELLGLLWPALEEPS